MFKELPWNMQEQQAVQHYLEQRRKARKLLSTNHASAPEIEKNVPLPSKRGGAVKFDHFYPFELMEPGDSFWVPSSTFCTAGAVTKFSKRTGWKFVTRGQAKNGTPNGKARKKDRGTRVWRVA